MTSNSSSIGAEPFDFIIVGGGTAGIVSLFMGLVFKLHLWGGDSLFQQIIRAILMMDIR